MHWVCHRNPFLLLATMIRYCPIWSWYAFVEYYIQCLGVFFGLHSELHLVFSAHALSVTHLLFSPPCLSSWCRITLIFLWSLPPRLPFLSPSFLPDSSSVLLFRQIEFIFSISTNRCDKKDQFCYLLWEVPLGAHTHALRQIKEWWALMPLTEHVDWFRTVKPLLG